MYRESSKKSVPTSILSNRPRAMKSLEDTYGVKYHSTPSKTSHKSPIKSGVASTVSFKDRGDMDYTEPLESYRPNYNKYLITASDRYGQPLPTSRRKGVTFNQSQASTTVLEERRAEVLSQQEQYFSKTEKTTTSRTVASKPQKSVRSHNGVSDDINFMTANISGNFEKTELNNYLEEDLKKKRSEHHRHHHKPHGTNAKDVLSDDKDDDTEEFIALIKRAVEKSVIKSMTEVMTNTFSEINKKVDRQAAEIKKIGTVVQKLHNSLSSKIAHYGEENSRHFRYLCMKSEYDKMFYQHHNQIVAKSTPATPPSSSKGSSTASARKGVNSGKSCTIPSARTLVPEQQFQAMEHSRKPIDENMRDMVAQLKKFCHQYESTIILEEDLANKSGTSGSSALQLNNGYQSRAHLFPDDEANFSSDGMTPRSIDNGLTTLQRKHSKNSINGEAMNSLNDSSLGGGDA